MQRLQERPRTREPASKPELREIVEAFRDSLTPRCTDFASAVRSMDADDLLADAHLDKVKGYHVSWKVGVSGRALLTGIADRDFKAKYMIAEWTPRNFSGWTAHISIFVGHYGDEVAKNLAFTTYLLMTSFERSVAAELFEDLARDRELFKKQELRSPIDVFADGVRSVGESFCILMAEKVPGIADPGEAMRAITTNGLPNRLSQVMPFGVLGTMRDTGMYPSHMLEQGERRELRLSRDFVVRCNSARADWLTLKRHVTQAIGMGCPVGKKTGFSEETGIQAMTEAFGHAFGIVQANGLADLISYSGRW